MCKKDNAFAAFLNDKPKKYKYKPYPSYVFFLKLAEPEKVLVILLTFVLIPTLFQLEHFVFSYGIKIAAVGDISCNFYGKTTTHIIANMPQLVPFLGDLPYNDTSHKCFFDNAKKIEYFQGVGRNWQSK